MIRPEILIAILLAACRQEPQPEANSVLVENAARIERSGDDCAQPELVLADGSSSLKSSLIDETRANFATAFKSACAKDVFKAGALIDPAAADQAHLFLVNAPEANVASIYLSEVDGNRMMLEYPFLTIDGKSQVPSVEELEEGIYCAVVGATPEEQESSGRCLVD